MKTHPQVVIDLLNNYEHSIGQGEKNKLAESLTTLLGIGDHQFGDRTIRVEIPKQHDGWTEYELTQVMDET